MLRFPPLILAGLLLLSGCLPYACRRDESRALLPSDSLSRAFAQQIPADTLALRWRTTGATAGLAFPRTVLFGPDGAVIVADAERNAVVVFDTTGAVDRILAPGTFDVPFLAGRRGDTLAVFSPGARRIDFVLGDAVVRRVPTPTDLPARGTLQYAAVTDHTIFFKTLGDDVVGYLARLDERGRIRDRVPLPGPAWRHAGLLRPWGDTLVSLSGFRPVVDLLPPGATALDTLALVGFDSPMLARSRLFLLGETHEAPLLIESGAAAGDALFLLNLRPGWLQVDVYDRQGRLRHRLIGPDPAYDKQFYPRDLAVRPHPGGGYTLAVVFTGSEPGVAVFRWRGERPDGR